MDTFYDNLETIYTFNTYTLDQIWNYDETWVQAGKDGGSLVIAKLGLHSMVPNEWEWL